MDTRATAVPIWVINLPRSEQRRDAISAHLRALGLASEIVPAVDGHTLSNHDLAEVYSASSALTHIGRALAPSEIGCALSHLRLYRRMVTENIDRAVILEDDAVVGEGVLEVLSRLAHAPADCELLLLYHDGVISRWHRQALSTRYRIGAFTRPVFGALAYVIRQSAARKILARAYPICVPADHWTGAHEHAGVRVYGLEPVCAQQRHGGDDFATSTIAEERERYRKMSPSYHPLSAIQRRTLQLKRGLVKRFHHFLFRTMA